tara:strand:+ start:11361 stop:11663 length:303 start_codon:yes stop_codon:yes gene_type:complete
MKQKFFNKYADEVCIRFGIDRTTLFTKLKRRDVVDARYLLYYLCYARRMRIRDIQEYMSENGYDISHTAIIHGNRITKKRVSKDKDYTNLVKDIKECITA